MSMKNIQLKNDNLVSQIINGLVIVLIKYYNLMILNFKSRIHVRVHNTFHFWSFKQYEYL